MDHLVSANRIGRTVGCGEARTAPRTRGAARNEPQTRGAVRSSPHPTEPDHPWYVPIHADDPAKDPIPRLWQRFDLAESASVHLLTGFRGNGKSTELRRLRKFVWDGVFGRMGRARAMPILTHRGGRMDIALALPILRASATAPHHEVLFALFAFICGKIRFRNPLTGLTMGEDIRGYCWNCGHGLTRLDLGRETDCPGCRKPTHCCRNCRHFAPGRPNECMEPQVERVVDKIRANFCEFFEPNSKAPTDTAVVDADALRRAAELLFGPRQ